MSLNRRRFIQTSIAAGAALAVTGPSLGRVLRSPGSKRILILGGTAFLGPACMEAALARGHKVTLFNRGRIEQRRKDLNRPLDFPEGVEVLYGNRDPLKTADEWKPGEERDATSPKGLSQLEGKSWDAVIDTSGYWPRMVKASAELLAPKVQQYVFISTISVYAKNDTPGADETAPLVTLADPATEDMGASGENYGGGKALCEAAAQAAMPGRCTIIRPGFIVGPRDSSARFLYWPRRVSRGGEVAVPGDPNDPIQLIDVRDLAEWTIACIEQGTTGVFNATGPEKELNVKTMLEGVAKGVEKPDTTFTFFPWEFAQQQEVQIGEFPLLIPPTGPTAGFHRVSVARAVSKGLKFRPVSESAKGALDWFYTLTPQGQIQAGRTSISEDREKALLEAYKASKK